MIQLLDCTLRDGGYINNWQFGKTEFLYLIEELSEANVDYIEAGFLNEINYADGSTNFSDVSTAEREMNDVSISTPLALMVRPDRYDFNKLCIAKGKIRYLRIAFYRKDLDVAIRFAKSAADNGYNLFFNLVNSAGYSTNQLKETASRLSDINPYAVTIVDTFGCMTQQKLEDFIDVFDRIMPNPVKIAFHPHNNMLMAYPLAQIFIELVNSCHRDGIVDGTLMGIGRKPGNLPSELIANHLNSLYGEKYRINRMSSVIENVIEPIKIQNDWGYSPAYMLGAAAKINRNYVEYFLQNGLPLNAIHEANRTVPRENAELYNADVARAAFDTALERWKCDHCAFRLFYKYSEDQSFGGINVYDFRYAAGYLMASCVPKDIVDSIDYIIPVPNTGNSYANGFSEAIGKKLIKNLIRKDSSNRTFYINDLQKRKTVLEDQIILDDSTVDIRGKNVVLVDEAIFSGITIKTVCKKLRKASVGKIIVIIPIGLWKSDCRYNELPNQKKLGEEMASDNIANYVGADEVFIQNEFNLKNMIGKHDYGICFKCFCS